MKKYSVLLQTTTMGHGQSKPCPTIQNGGCQICQDCNKYQEENCDECPEIYDTKEDYCDFEVYGPLRAQQAEALAKLKEEHTDALGKLDAAKLTLEAKRDSLQVLVSDQNLDIGILRRWLHCEASSDSKGYLKEDNTYEEDFKGKPYWTTRFEQCESETGRYTAEKDNCDTWLGVCNDYLTPYCSDIANDCGGWWTLPPAEFDRQGKQCTDSAAADAIALENPVLPQ